MPRTPARTRPARRAFTLLEVMLAIAILAGAIVVLVSSQATAVLMTTDAEKMITATMLAREKMAEVQVLMEQQGFSDQEIADEGDFSDLDAGAADALSVDMHLDVGDAYDDFHWAYVVREVDLQLGGDLDGMVDQLASSGFWGEPEESASTTSFGPSTTRSSGETPNLSDMGVSPDMITDLLGNYIRELRVLVWWGDDPEGEDRVELVTHIINPTGVVFSTTGSSGEEQ